MKRIVMRCGNQLKKIEVSILAIAIVSILGGFLLSTVIYSIEDSRRVNADQLLAIEDDLNHASVSLGRQIQEWKDMLLRASDAQRYSTHQKAFIDTSVDVQYALMRATVAMKDIGMDTTEIELLQNEHKSLLATYLRAHTLLNPNRSESSHLVDHQVVGADRDLQDHLATASEGIEHLLKQKYADSAPTSGNRYLVIAVFGLALLFMALLGLLIAHLFHGVAANRSRHLSKV